MATKPPKGTKEKAEKTQASRPPASTLRQCASGTTRPGAASCASSQKAPAQTRLAKPKIQKTPSHGITFARRGPKQTAMDCPAVPSPNRPSARPCFSGGNHLFVELTPTAKLEPATPRKKPPISSPAYECTSAIQAAGKMAKAMSSAKTRLPP